MATQCQLCDSYKVVTLQSDLQQLLNNASTLLQLIAWCATFLYISGQLLNIFTMLCYRRTPWFKVYCKLNHLVIIDYTIDQAIYPYILIHTTNLLYIIIIYYIYFHANRIIIFFYIKRTDETSDNDCQCTLNIFCWVKLLKSLMDWVQNSTLKQLSSMNDE